MVGDDCTVGHRAILHGCTLGDRVLVGMGAIVLDNAEVGDDAVIAAGWQSYVDLARRHVAG